MAKPNSTKALQETLRLKLDYDQLTNCMRCGFCLPACPTFKETGLEAESPRGRISLMKAAVDGLMEPGISFEDQMNHCLGCRACEPACPADVKYGQLIEQARDAIEDHTTQHRPWVKLTRNVMFKRVFPNQGTMKLLGKSLKLYRQTGIRSIVRKTNAVALFNKQMADMEKVLPDVTGKSVTDFLGTRIPAQGEKLATVGMFRGCLMDSIFTDTNRKTVELLSMAGFEVVIPEVQNCCGALHAHSGELDQARELAKSNIKAFQEANVDYIVSNAGGCGALLVEYDHLLHKEEEWKEGAEWFAKRVKDVSSLLLEVGRPLQFEASVESKDTGNGQHTEYQHNKHNVQYTEYQHNKHNAQHTEYQLNNHNTQHQKSLQNIRVTYQDSCHLKNVMKGSSAPRALLNQIKHITFVEMKDAGSCCGSAGIYNITQPVMANQILEHKMVAANATEAHYMVTSNPGCLMQMQLGIDRHAKESGMKAVHIVDFLYDHVVR